MGFITDKQVNCIFPRIISIFFFLYIYFMVSSEKKENGDIKLKLLNSSLLMKQLKQLPTMRSCPTGYDKMELETMPTLELLHLRKTTYEYLKLKSSKTRNSQFVELVRRINKELHRRSINIPVSINDQELAKHCYSENSKNKVSFDELIHYTQILNKRSIGEYCYLTIKRGKVSSKELILDSMVLCNSHFQISSSYQQSFPQFLHDNSSMSYSKAKSPYNESANSSSIILNPIFHWENILNNKCQASTPADFQMPVQLDPLLSEKNLSSTDNSLFFFEHGKLLN